MVDAVISDSLRRARPTRFSGSDLSRSGPAAHAVRPSGTPASRQFWPGALRMQGFSQNLAHLADDIAATLSVRQVCKPIPTNCAYRAALSDCRIGVASLALDEGAWLPFGGRRRHLAQNSERFGAT